MAKKPIEARDVRELATMRFIIGAGGLAPWLVIIRHECDLGKRSTRGFVVDGTATVEIFIEKGFDIDATYRTTFIGRQPLVDAGFVEQMHTRQSSENVKIRD